MEGEKVIPDALSSRSVTRASCERVRTDDIRAGLAALSSVCRERLAEPDASPQRLRSHARLDRGYRRASTRLTRNVNATMLLQWLLVHLDN